MADPEDLRLLLAGERDLSSCDFSEANLHCLDLRNRNFTKSKFTNAVATQAVFSGSIFNGALLLSLKAAYADFSKCRFANILQNNDFANCNFAECDFGNSNLLNSDFSGANFSGASFRGATFGDGVRLENVTIDSITDFDGATTSRASSRLPIFKDYIFENGKLRKRQEGQHLSRDAEPTASEANTLRVMSQRIQANSTDYGLMAASLVDLIGDEIERLSSEKPNEPEALQKFSEYIEFLENIRSDLTNISSQLTAISKNLPQSLAAVNQASSSIYNLFKEACSWIEGHKTYAIDVGAKTAILGAGFTFLKVCGAPVEASFYAMGFLVGGKQLVEAATGAIKGATNKAKTN